MRREWFIVISVILFVGCKFSFSKQKKEASQSDSVGHEKSCVVCERIALFDACKDLVANNIWKGLSNDSLVPPLVYFTDSETYIAFLEDETVAINEFSTVNCGNGLILKKLPSRLDEQVFHMENKINFSDTLSLFYYRPMMLCSDVETMTKVVPEFTKTEAWLQLVMHEYFHSFQFSHKANIDYLAQSIRIGADTLDKIYRGTPSFQKDLQLENDFLLKAFKTNLRDSMYLYVDGFVVTRESRRANYEKQYDFDLTTMENYWETMEGTARYAEYYMAGNFAYLSLPEPIKCDTLFQGFRDYKGSKDFETIAEFKERTEIMEAYYYVTGFNLCRLMDKLGIEYKTQLFDNPESGLYNIFIEGFNKIRH